MKKTSVSLLLMAIIGFSVMSCGGDSSDNTPSLNKTSITLYVDETEILTYSGGDCSWWSDNDLIATVDNGTVTGKHVGETIIHAKDKTCTVTVKAKYNSYTEPCMEWGASQSRIESLMSGYTLRSSSSTSLIYEGKGKVVAYGYSFESNALKASTFAVSLYNTDLLDFLTERYVVAKVEEESSSEYWVYMASVDEKMIVGLNVTKTGCIVVYMPVSSSRGSATRNTDVEAELTTQIKFMRTSLAESLGK